MKKLFSVMIMLLLSTAVQAQKDVTRFLGIPVDGSKSEMIRQLKAKGFRSDPYDSDALTGEFNGRNVEIRVVTNNNKVYRIAVVDANPADERAIQIRFNDLCRQFENNDKYVALLSDRIPEAENLSYEILVNKKRYEAAFSQKTTGLGLSDRNKMVWFMIGEQSFGKYVILMFYDNEYNRANGEDL